jgi:hypothetical protein
MRECARVSSKWFARLLGSGINWLFCWGIFIAAKKDIGLEINATYVNLNLELTERLDTCHFDNL